MNKERMGSFIGAERKARGLTQRDLAARLHVTDKAVSKWERGLSYPDVTLLEPLAAALDLGVEELMACRRQETTGEEETMQTLLDISQDSVRRERRRSWKRLGAVLALLAVIAAVAAYTRIMVTEERQTLLCSRRRWTAPTTSMWRTGDICCGCNTRRSWILTACCWRITTTRWYMI